VYQSFEDLEALKREVDLLYNDRDTIAIDVRRGGGRSKVRPK
jgi:hypothetical protein